MPKRFKIGIIILFLSLLLIYFIPTTPKFFINATFLICAATWLWFFADYELLQINKIYLYALIVSLVILSYGYFLQFQDVYYDKDQKLEIGTKLPLILLLIQRPLRLVYLFLFKTEPIVEKSYFRSIQDIIYTLILWLTFIITFLLLYK